MDKRAASLAQDLVAWVRAVRGACCSPRLTNEKCSELQISCHSSLPSECRVTVQWTAFPVGSGVRVITASKPCTERGWVTGSELMFTFGGRFTAAVSAVSPTTRGTILSAGVRSACPSEMQNPDGPSRHPREALNSFSCSAPRRSPGPLTSQKKPGQEVRCEHQQIRRSCARPYSCRSRSCANRGRQESLDDPSLPAMARKLVLRHKREIAVLWCSTTAAAPLDEVIAPKALLALTPDRPAAVRTRPFRLPSIVRNFVTALSQCAVALAPRC